MKHLMWINGIGLSAIIMLMANSISHTSFALQLHLSALTMAIILGIVVGNTFYSKIEPYVNQGILFAKGQLLRLGIILYGFNITLQDLHSVGFQAIWVDSVMLISTFVLTCWVGIYWLNIDKKIVYLTASGCSICGAAAIMATTPVVKGESHQVSVSVALIVIFGSISMFLYPILYPYLNCYLTDHQFGIYIGSSVHEVAQVYAAGGSISASVADTAVITKMIRVIMLAPFLICLSYLLRKPYRHKNPQNTITIPYFAIGFIAVAIFNSANLLPANVINLFKTIDNVLLLVAMSALGLTTQLKAMKQAGIKPLLLGLIIFLWLVVGGFIANYLATCLP